MPRADCLDACEWLALAMQATPAIKIMEPPEGSLGEVPAHLLGIYYNLAELRGQSCDAADPIRRCLSANALLWVENLLANALHHHFPELFNRGKYTIVGRFLIAEPKSTTPCARKSRK